MAWGFYGRGTEAEDLTGILAGNRWFFVKVTGRRRIGKTTLIQLYEERSRKRLPGFALTERVRGYWDRRATEIDFVALDEQHRIVRLCNVKRSADKLLASERVFLTNVDRFLEAFPHLREWRVERAMVTTVLETPQREELVRRGYHAEDLMDLLPPLPAA